MWSRVSVVSPSAMNIYRTTQNNLLIFFSRVLEAPCCPTLGNDTTHMRGVNTAQRRVAHARGSMRAWCARIERERPFSRDQRRNKFRHYGRLSWQKVICPLTLFRVCLIVQECVIKERRNISVNKFNIGVRSLWNTKHDTKRRLVLQATRWKVYEKWGDYWCSSLREKVNIDRGIVWRNFRKILRYTLS